MLAVHITEHGTLNTDAIAIEPEHAAILVPELLELAAHLQAIALSGQPRLIRVK